MDTGLLEQLMKKPIPKKQAQVQIILPGKGEVAIKTKIVERKRPDIDIAALRKRLQEATKVRSESKEIPTGDAPSVEVDIKPPPRASKKAPSAKRAPRPAKSLFTAQEEVEEVPVRAGVLQLAVVPRELLQHGDELLLLHVHRVE